MLEKVTLKTSKKGQMMDITGEVEMAVGQSGITEGIALVYSPHTTAGIAINEGADPDVVRDILYALDKNYPWNDPGYHHGEGNAAAHIKSIFAGASQLVPISEGKLILGTWQTIYFCEFDGPRTRNLYIKIMEG